MAMYKVSLTKEAQKDMLFFGRNAPHLYKKAQKLLQELELDPRNGSGRPKPLRLDLQGKWSRRIDDEHRMVYTIDDDVVTVEVLRMRYHYD